MGDRALKVTERQFGALMSKAAGGIDVQFRVFALKRTTRSPRAFEYISAHYEPASAAMEAETWTLSSSPAHSLRPIA